MATLFILKLFVFTYFLGVFAKRERKDAPADIAVVNESGSGPVADPDLITALPDTIRVNISLLNQQDPIALELKRSKLMDKKKSMFNIRRNAEGKPVLVRKNVGLESNVGYYQDVEKEASMKVKCEGVSEGVCSMVLSGTVGEYVIEPLKLEDLNTTVRKRRALLERPAPGKRRPRGGPIGFRPRNNRFNAAQRVQQTQQRNQQRLEKKEARQQQRIEQKQQKRETRLRNQTEKKERRRKKLLYGVFKKKMKRMRRRDSMRRKKGQIIKRPKNSALLKGANMLKMVPEINADNAPAEILGKNLANTKVQTAASTGGRDGSVLAKETYNVEILAVIDYQTYVRFLDEQMNGTNDEKDDEAYKDIRQYFSQVINGIDMRYRGIKSRPYQIRVTLSNFIVLDNPDYPDWDSHKGSNTVPDEAGNQHYVLDVEQAILKLSEWRKDMIETSTLPEHDHLMLFSDHDLSSQGEIATSGFAFVGEICSPYSVSIIEDFGLYESILIGTHELGHSLGADHDGQDNTCDSADSFIMADVSGNTNENTLYNPYAFSSCSLDAFKKYIDSLQAPGSGSTNENCLLDEALIFDVMEFNAAIEVPPGQLSNPNQQCQDRLGSDSYYGWGGNLGEYDEVCHQMSCKSSASKFSYKVYTALPGTSCGNKKWCMKGRCVGDKRAPPSRATCVHGDSLRKFENNETCAELISSYPAYCYDEYYLDFCCDSCERAKSNKPNCPFKDRSTRCVEVFTKPSLCYQLKNYETCCDSCAQLDSGIKDCRFGDKQDNCDAQYCSLPGNKSYRESCCKTCANGNIGTGNQGIGEGGSDQGTGGGSGVDSGGSVIIGQESGQTTGNQGTQGTGDQGTSNQGTRNQGTGDQGMGNQGTVDQGTVDQGTGNQEIGNQGTGTSNQGTDNQGTGSQGTGDQGTGDLGTGDQGMGTGNQGTVNQGTGTSNQGTGQGTEQGTSAQGTEQGTGTQDMGQETGSQGTEQGTGTQGTGSQGTGSQGTGSQGLGTQGTGQETGTQGTEQGTGTQGTEQGTDTQGTGTQGTGQETGIQGTEQGTGTQGTGSQEPGTQGTEQGTGTQGTEQGTGSQGTGDQGTSNQETGSQGTDNQGPDTQHGYCLKKGGRVGFFSCSAIAYMIPRICTLERFKRSCCERCSGCVNYARCTLRYTSDCYDPEVQKACCQSCKNYKTNKAECEYGDKHRSCRTYVRYNSQYTCRNYGKTCCLSCDNVDPRWRSRRVTRLMARTMQRTMGKPEVRAPKAQNPQTTPRVDVVNRQETNNERKIRQRKERLLNRQKKRMERWNRLKRLREQRRQNRRNGRRRG